jgi:hypothetical protein
MCYVNNDYKGFMVTQKQENYGRVSLHVWAAYSEADDFDVLENGTGQLKEWANNIKARKITFSTTRKGWSKVAPKLGFEPTLTTYELELS